MAKQTCRYCGKEINSAVIAMHENACQAKDAPRPSEVAMAQAFPVAPAPVIAPAPAPVEMPPWEAPIQAPAPVPVSGLDDTEMAKATSWAILKSQGNLNSWTDKELLDLLQRATPEQEQMLDVLMTEAMDIAPAPKPTPGFLESLKAIQDEPDDAPIVPVTEPSSNGVYYPTINPVYIIPRTLGQQLDRIEAMSNQHPQNILLIGQQGAGKTELAKQFAAKFNRPMMVIPCVTMQEQMQWWGQYQVTPERGTYYVPSAHVKAIETPRCVVVYDDMNRVENPKVLNPLFPILDDRRETHLDELNRTIRVADGVVFFATINEGFAFQGTDPVDQALRDRFDQVNVGYPKKETVSKILIARTGISFSESNLIAQFSENLATHRTHPVFISMRQLIRIAESRVAGARIRDAVHFTMTASLAPEELEGVLQNLQILLPSDYQAEEEKWEAWGA